MKTVVLLSDVRATEKGSKERYLPLAILAIGSVLKNEGYRPVLIDVQIEPRWRDILEANLPDALMFGVSALTGNSIHSVLDAIEVVRDRAPDLPIV